METFQQKILFLAYYKSRIWPSLPWLVVTSGSVNISGMIDSVDRGERISPGCLDPGAPAMWSEKETSRALDKVRFEIQAQGGKSASLLTPTPRGSGGNPVTSQLRRTSRSLPSTRGALLGPGGRRQREIRPDRLSARNRDPDPGGAISPSGALHFVTAR
jgi:hypothetical protein